MHVVIAWTGGTLTKGLAKYGGWKTTSDKRVHRCENLRHLNLPLQSYLIKKYKVICKSKVRHLLILKLRLLSGKIVVVNSELVILVKPVRVNGRQSQKQVICSRVCFSLEVLHACSVLVVNSMLDPIPRVTHKEGEFVDFCRPCLFRRSRSFVRMLHVMQMSFLRLSEIVRALFESSHG